MINTNNHLIGTRISLKFTDLQFDMCQCTCLEAKPAFSTDLQFVGHLCNAGLKIEREKEHSNISSYISDGKGTLSHSYIKENCTTEVTK